MIGTYASAILICVVAVVLGRAICLLAGAQRLTWMSAPIGFAALMIVCQVALGLPGRGPTAVGVVVVLCALSAWLIARRRAGWPSLIDALPVGLVVLAFVSVPFIANWRVGILGVSVLNDTRWHLILAQGLLNPSIRTMDHYGAGYPVGPHAVAAAFAWGLGTGVDKTLTGVLMATPILTGLAALGAVTDLSRIRRWLVAMLAAAPYLAAGLYAESAFKEPVMSLLLVGLVLVLGAQDRRAFDSRPAGLVLTAVLVAGILYVYSYPGLAWPAAIAAFWVALRLVFAGDWRRVLGFVRGMPATVGSVTPTVSAVAAGALVFALLVAPNIGRIHTFYVVNHGVAAGTEGGLAASPLANLVSPLRSLEGLNIWLSGDFRFVPPDALKAGALAGFALIVLVFAFVSALERRDLAWPAGILGCALLYVWLKDTQSPYVASKGLAIPAPLIALGSGAALMRRLERPNWRSLTTITVAAAAIAFFYLSFDSDYLVLHDAQVDPANHINELRALRPLLHDKPTLVLFYDDLTQWELLGVPVSSPLLVSFIPSTVQAAKPWSYGQPLYFDSVDATTLNRFDYVITTRTDAGSPPPPNFRLVGGSRSYEVWRRVGPTPAYHVLPGSRGPGAFLDCHTPLGKRVSRERGLALVEPVPPRYFNVPVLAPGNTARVALTLPAGRWDLSLPFTSPQAVTVSGPGLHAWLPPNVDRPGSIWPIGQVRSSGGPVRLTLAMADPAPISSDLRYFTPQQLIAVPPSPWRTVPLSAACGRYVDWYEAT